MWGHSTNTSDRHGGKGAASGEPKKRWPGRKNCPPTAKKGSQTGEQRAMKF